MAEKGVAILLLLFLGLSGLVISFNLTERYGIDLGLGFEHINGFFSGIWIILARFVGLVLFLLSIYISYKIVVEG